MTNTNNLQLEIDKLELLEKQGESYTDTNGRFGWRNPIRKDTGHLLTGLVITSSPRRILEIGTGHGLSTLYLAKGLDKELKPTIDTLEFHPDVAQSTQERMNQLQLPVTVIHGDASATIPTLTGHYDLVFFDAQKNKYHEQLELLLENQLIGKGSILLADNVLDRKEECASFLKWFETNTKDHTIVETECGLLVAKL
jgi:predicted O-methyltransferase YrrM